MFNLMEIPMAKTFSYDYFITIRLFIPQILIFKSFFQEYEVWLWLIQISANAN